MSTDDEAKVAGAVGGVAGAAGSVATVAAAGSVAGLGAAGITSGLAAVDSVVGGGMARTCDNGRSPIGSRGRRLWYLQMA